MSKHPKEVKLRDVELKDVSEAYLKVLYWFFSFPNIETGLNDLSSDLKISKTTAKKIIETLEKEKFLIKKVYGKTWQITCDKAHIYNFTRKVAFNLHMVLEAYTGGLREQIRGIVGNTKAVILFGSYRKGDDTEKSDVDIAVEVAEIKEIRIIKAGIIPMFGFRPDVPVSLHIFSREKIDVNLFANMANGIVLEGFLEVRP